MSDSGYFGKLIDRGELENILVSDIPGTAAHASSERLALYVVNQGMDSCTCIFISRVPPSHIYNYWKEASGTEGLNSLLGLYKEDCGQNAKPLQSLPSRTFKRLH